MLAIVGPYRTLNTSHKKTRGHFRSYIFSLTSNGSYLGPEVHFMVENKLQIRYLNEYIINIAELAISRVKKESNRFAINQHLQGYT